MGFLQVGSKKLPQLTLPVDSLPAAILMTAMLMYYDESKLTVCS
jgi:hypothetical protein